MLERDYIMKVIRQLGQVIARLLHLKSTGSDKPQMEEAVAEGLGIAGLGEDPARVDEAMIAAIDDQKVLVSLSELLSIYLAEYDDENISRIYGLVTARLKEQKSLVFDTSMWHQE